ncbi:hypothetical protein SUDANB126_00204 [Streptomyces sp. enrichment culture]
MIGSGPDGPAAEVFRRALDAPLPADRRGTPSWGEVVMALVCVAYVACRGIGDAGERVPGFPPVRARFPAGVPSPVSPGR